MMKNKRKNNGGRRREREEGQRAQRFAKFLQVHQPEGGLRLLQVCHRHANWNWAAFEDDPGAAGPRNLTSHLNRLARRSADH